MAPRRIAGAILALIVLAAIDGNYTHWSCPVGKTECAPAAAAAESTSGEWAQPLPAGAFDHSHLDDPHHDHPSLDIPVVTGVPVMAIRGGTVTYLGGDCGLGVQITDPAGVEWGYCHGSTRAVDAGVTVAAGTQVLASGSTGESTGPHLHIQIRAGGLGRCPQTLVGALYASGDGLDPSTLPSSGCVG